MKKEPISSGRKLTWNETFIWLPIARFAGKLLLLSIFSAIFLILSFVIIKFIKFLWYV